MLTVWNAIHFEVAETRSQHYENDSLTQRSIGFVGGRPFEVVKKALSHNAASVMLVHNHPSGVAEPSESDLMLTRALVQALALVDVRVLDHFVVAGPQVHSFAEHGQM